MQNYFYLKMLSSDRLKYIEGIQKYTRFSVVTTIAIMIVVLVIVVVDHIVIKGKELSGILYSSFLMITVIFPYPLSNKKKNQKATRTHRTDD